MGEQGLPRQVNRTLGGQDARCERRHHAGGIAKTGHQAKGRDAVERFVKGVLAHRVIDHFDALAAGDVLDPRQEVLPGVIDGMGRAMLQGQRAFGVRAGGADQLQPHGFGPLAGDQTNTARRRMKQHIVARLQATLRLRALEQVLSGQALEHHGCAGFKRDALGQLAHGHGWHDAGLAIAARRLTGVGGTVANLQMRDTGAHRLHHARGLHANVERHLHRIHTAAVIDIDEIEAHSLVPNSDLARSGLAHFQLDQFHFFGATMLVDTYRFYFACHVYCLRVGFRKNRPRRMLP